MSNEDLATVSDEERTYEENEVKATSQEMIQDGNDIVPNTESENN